MAKTDIGIKLENPCVERKDFCINCNSHFMAVRPYLKSVIVSKHFFKDLKDEEKAKSIVKDVLDCSRADFTELHKFEENVDGSMIFRARKEDMHVVYCVDKNMRIIFLRALRNYSEYARFLEDKKEIRKIIAHV
jgi:mRNA-degrading endonuclease RelE of RelBE toxin-antitoxin system